ncbi:MAG: sugar translocase [Nocardioides sp.]|nr:sugar translocase [Nocardioides sp.]
MGAIGHGTDSSRMTDTARTGAGRERRLRWGSVGRPGDLRVEVPLFLLVGATSTVVYGLLYLLLRQSLTAQVANGLALLATAIANTAANRRFTFGIRGRTQVLRQHLGALAVFAVGLLLTGGSLWALKRVDPDVRRAYEILVLTITNLMVTVMRFVAMRTRIFRHQLLPSQHE